MDMNEFNNMILSFGFNDDDKKEVWKRMGDRNMSPADPESIRIVLQYELEKTANKINSFGGKLAAGQKQHLEAVVKSLNEATELKIKELHAAGKKISSEAVKEIAESIAKSAEDALVKISEQKTVKNILAYGIASVILAGIVGWSGYSLGRNDTNHVANQYAELASRSDGIEWLRIARINNLTDLGNLCRPGGQGYSVQGGKAVCAVPLWLSESASPVASNSAGSSVGMAWDQLTAWMRSFSPWLVLAAGGLLATIGRKALRTVKGMKPVKWLLDI
jgi:hypothetical protein